MESISRSSFIVTFVSAEAFYPRYSSRRCAILPARKALDNATCPPPTFPSSQRTDEAGGKIFAEASELH